MPPSVEYPSATLNNVGSTLRSRVSSRGLNEIPTSPLGVFSPARNHAILSIGVACASLSLLAALISLRWFLLMRRSYRHHLILFLIISDTWKSMWYFIFPIVIFSKGKIESSSPFCQAAGFFLSFGLEASDFAILMIALHTLLHIFKKPQIKGEGGLYPYRNYIYPLWLGLPLLSAGLAFTNPQGAYVTSGTFCYLPKRPFWYRLALSWIPRYSVFLCIFTMYVAIWVYVHIRFRGFRDVGMDSSRYASESGSHNLSETDQSRNSSKAFNFGSTGKQRETATSGIDSLETTERAPWENISFITSKPLHNAGVVEADFATGSSSTETQVASRHLSIYSTVQDHISDSRKHSDVLTLGTTHTMDTVATESATASVPESAVANTLKSTRSQIRRQLRLLFVYPGVYLLMWTFPFASHCLLYSDYYAAHPPFWLSVVTTASLSLQAGVDCAVFSWRERPWNRIDESSRRSLTSLLGQFRKSNECEPPSLSTLVEEEPGKRDSNWWEAEGKKRRDSVWLGTDQLHQVINRQNQEEGTEHA